VSVADWLHKHPLLRPLLYLAVGIAVGDALFFRTPFAIPTVYLIVASAIGVAALFPAYYLGRTRPIVFEVSVFLCFFVGGGSLSYYRLDGVRVDWSDSPAIYRAWITSSPVEKPRTYQFRATVDTRNVLLYLPKDSLGASVRRGDELSFRAVVNRPANNDTLRTFDYARYLYRQGVSGTVFVPRGRWMLESYRTQSSWLQVAFDARDRVLELYRRLPFSDEQRSLLAALTVGYKDELTTDIRESFSASGVAHVLAVSGLHVGLIYGLFLLFVGGRPLRSRWMQGGQTLLILLLLWMFAFITGLSPSVVRAVTMFSLLALSRFVRGSSVAFNTLCTTALAMLVFRPSWLFDVGFQMSFSSVAAIHYLQQPIRAWWSPTNRVVAYMWDIATVSIAAQIGVTPLVLFYFGHFSVHFLLSNLAVVPLMALIMYAAVAMLALSPVSFLCTAVAWVVKGLLATLLWLVRTVEALPYAVIDHIRFGLLDLTAYYLLLVLLIVYLHTRKVGVLIGFLVVLLLYVTFLYFLIPWMNG
jgi:competence protein ComEC